jgi:hypothetical protein
MTDHHPDAETVPPEAVEWWCQTRYRRSAFSDHPNTAGDLTVWGIGATDAIQHALAALSAAGLAVVRVGDVPPWMEDGFCVDCGCAWAASRPLHDTTIYVLKESQ